MKKTSFISSNVFAVRARTGGLWTYGFAVLRFCKKRSTQGSQAGADERGFRDVAPSVALTAGLDAVWRYVCSRFGVGSLSSSAGGC